MSREELSIIVKNNIKFKTKHFFNIQNGVEVWNFSATAMNSTKN